MRGPNERVTMAAMRELGSLRLCTMFMCQGSGAFPPNRAPSTPMRLRRPVLWSMQLVSSASLSEMSHANCKLCRKACDRPWCLPRCRSTLWHHKAPAHSFESGMTDIRAASIDAIPFGSDVKRRPAGAITKESGGNANGLVHILSGRRVHRNAYIQEKGARYRCGVRVF